MALNKCPDCGKDVSSQAPTCPNCGRPIAGTIISEEIHGSGEGLFLKGMNCGCAVILGVVALLVILIVIAMMSH